VFKNSRHKQTGFENHFSSGFNYSVGYRVKLGPKILISYFSSLQVELPAKLLDYHRHVSYEVQFIVFGLSFNLNLIGLFLTRRGKTDIKN